MIVFKNYLKVAKSFLPIIIVYTLIFVGIATISSTSGAQNTDAFEASESRIGIYKSRSRIIIYKFLSKIY